MGKATHVENGLERTEHLSDTEFVAVLADRTRDLRENPYTEEETQRLRDLSVKHSAWMLERMGLTDEEKEKMSEWFLDDTFEKDVEKFMETDERITREMAEQMVVSVKAWALNEFADFDGTKEKAHG